MSTPIIVEICVDSPQSVQAAVRGGAHRLELCGSLLEGGITPSAGMIATVRSQVTVDLHIMIRPRGGDFCYNDDEMAAMKRDIVIAKQLHAEGVVFGILDHDGEVDMDRCRQLLDQTRPLKATFHRAFDMSRDLTRSLENIIALGFDRVLTSGGQQKVEQAAEVVARLREVAANRITLMIGSGINSGNVLRLLSQTGVREIHASARRIEPSPMRYRNSMVSMGISADLDYRTAVVDETEVRNIVQAVQAIVN